MDTVKIYDGREVLYNGTQPIGMGLIRAMDAPVVMTEGKAREILDKRGSFSFDYLGGRPLKVRAREGVINATSVRCYDRDAGEGAFERAIQKALG